MYLVNRRLTSALRRPLVNKLLCRSLIQQAPFDLEEQDDKYKDLNQMYVDMFSSATADTATEVNGLDEKSRLSDLDELNSDMDDLLNVGYNKLSPSELREKVQMPGRFILQSLSNNPYYNLAMENYVFANTPLNSSSEASYTNQRLLFYINDDCVVIGKNQTLWKEVHLGTLKERDYKLLRRFSGGGTVVHDLGNVNYSFLTSRDEFQREFFNKLIIEGIHRSDPGFTLALNPRGDIVLGDKKVSGSAYKIAKGKAYHHGTMLIRSNIDQFRGLLKPASIDGVTWNCSSVDSVRSQVQNIPLGSVEQFIDLTINEFKRVFRNDEQEEVPVFYCDEDVTINDEIREFMNVLESDDWKYMKGPKFELHLESGNQLIAVEKGLIVESTRQELIGSSFQSFIQRLSDFEDIDGNALL